MEEEVTVAEGGLGGCLKRSCVITTGICCGPCIACHYVTNKGVPACDQCLDTTAAEPLAGEEDETDVHTESLLNRVGLLCSGCLCLPCVGTYAAVKNCRDVPNVAGVTDGEPTVTVD
eukprot:41438_1